MQVKLGKQVMQVSAPLYQPHRLYLLYLLYPPTCFTRLTCGS